jgi:hypothetical protein
MASLRAAWGWLFAISAIACFWVTSQSIPVLSRHRPYGSHFVASVEAVIIFPIEATIFSVAWWSVWKGRASARSLGVAASLTWVLTALVAYLQFSRFYWGMLACGIVGVICFWPGNAKELRS